MAISAQTRKILWITAGGRCALCRDLLTTSDGLSVFGEEAHIVARSPGGPRAGEVADLDGYDNLILMCSKHHKLIDDQEGIYTVETLRQMKVAHSMWVKTQNEPFAYRPPTPTPQPAMAGGPNRNVFGMPGEVIFFGACVFVGLLFLGLLIRDGMLRVGTL
jgi:hypothetical protein